MASETPVLLPISTFSQELGNLLAASFVELEKKPVDRITSVSWEMKMLSDIGDQHKFFGSNQPQHHQLNYLEDLTEHDFLCQKDSAEFNQASGDDSDKDSDYEDLDSGSVSFNPQSPPRKRQKQPQQTPNQSEKTTFANPSLSSTTFEAFNRMAILSRNHDVWNQILRENPSFWEKKCLSWKTFLDEAYALRKVLL
ncbi:hypothetical protein GALMADRAFT_217637 [Galerina marginata CBS 339.88]|uniref:Uncharacterized protein n=1 Tax=Galerina marginata (strain CBS 339.88) TaxID=685588 RepID=A0A067SBS8_GALM3|nr:hypothetical protein GALMADRAFT_217637 [Galerina marginata CBS 339.88]